MATSFLTTTDFSNFDNLFSVMEYFHDENTCKLALAQARWGSDVVCPHCGQHHCTLRKYGRYRCNKCKHNFSCTVGTIIENTKLPLLKVVGNDDIGIVSNITSLINKEGDTVLRSVSINSIGGIFEGYLVIGINSLDNLDLLIKKIKNLKGVKDVQRTNR